MTAENNIFTLFFNKINDIYLANIILVIFLFTKRDQKINTNYKPDIDFQQIKSKGESSSLVEKCLDYI